MPTSLSSQLSLLYIAIIKRRLYSEKKSVSISRSSIVFIWNDVTIVLAKAERPIVTTCQRRNNHEFVLDVSILLSIDPTVSLHRKLQGGSPPIPSISGRNAACIALVKIRFEVFTDKPPCVCTKVKKAIMR